MKTLLLRLMVNRDLFRFGQAKSTKLLTHLSPVVLVGWAYVAIISAPRGRTLDGGDRKVPQHQGPPRFSPQEKAGRPISPSTPLWNLKAS